MCLFSILLLLSRLPFVCLCTYSLCILCKPGHTIIERKKECGKRNNNKMETRREFLFPELKGVRLSLKHLSVPTVDGLMRTSNNSLRCSISTQARNAQIEVKDGEFGFCNPFQLRFGSKLYDCPNLHHHIKLLKQRECALRQEIQHAKDLTSIYHDRRRGKRQRPAMSELEVERANILLQLLELYGYPLEKKRIPSWLTVSTKETPTRQSRKKEMQLTTTVSRFSGKPTTTSRVRDNGDTSPIDT
jgi:hypothetical protein